MTLRRRQVVVVCLLTAIGSPAGAQPAAGPEPLRIVFADIPNVITARRSDEPVGPLVDLIQRVRGRGLLPEWEGPYAWPRVLGLLEREPRPFCTPFAYQTRERRATLKAPQPFLPSIPMQVVSRAVNDRVLSKRSFAELLADDTLVLGLGRGISIGSDNDRKVEAAQPRMVTTPGSNEVRLNTLDAGRVDYLVTNGNVLFQDMPPARRRLYAVVDLPDLTPSDPIGFLCTPSTPDGVIERISLALAGADTTALKAIIEGRTPTE